jgi:hypothetical protein
VIPVPERRDPGASARKEEGVMKNVFDLVEAIYESIVEYFETTGVEPEAPGDQI